MKNSPLVAICVTTAFSLAAASMAFADGHKTAAPEGASVYFINLADGDTVTSPLTVRFGLSGMGIAPSGISEKENVGHHHLLINRAPFGTGPDGADDWEYGILADDNHVHFGGGQTEYTFELPKGQHTLQLVLGDHAHVPFGPELTTEQITITVN